MMYVKWWKNMDAAIDIIADFYSMTFNEGFIFCIVNTVNIMFIISEENVGSYRYV